MGLENTLPGGAAHAEAQRARATTLRGLATTMERAELTDLAGLAGPDTWHGPLADQCRDALRTMRGRFFASASGLRVAAAALERAADDLIAQPEPERGRPR